MRKKNYRGTACQKRTLPKCEEVCKTYDAIMYTEIRLLKIMVLLFWEELRVKPIAALLRIVETLELYPPSLLVALVLLAAVVYSPIA